MSPSVSAYFGSWDELTALVETSGSWARWRAWQPALAGVEDLAGLRAVLEDRTRLAAGEELLGALLRIASTAGRDDLLAARVVGLLMAPGAVSVAQWLTDRGIPDSHGVVAAQLWITVRTAPIDTWQRRYAANLLWATRRVLAADLLAQDPHGLDAMFHTIDADVVPEIPPGLATRRHLVPADRGDVFTHRRASPTRQAERALAAVLAWARSQGLLSADDAALLWDLTAAAGGPDGTGTGRLGWAEEQLASRYQVASRTIRRRRRRAVEVLAAHRQDYLAATA